MMLMLAWKSCTILTAAGIRAALHLRVLAVAAAACCSRSFFCSSSNFFSRLARLRLRRLECGWFGVYMLPRRGQTRLQIHDALVELVQLVIAHACPPPAHLDLIFQHGIVVVHVGGVVLQLGFELHLLLLQAAERLVGVASCIW